MFPRNWTWFVIREQMSIEIGIIIPQSRLTLSTSDCHMNYEEIFLSTTWIVMSIPS